MPKLNKALVKKLKNQSSLKPDDDEITKKSKIKMEQWINEFVSQINRVEKFYKDTFTKYTKELEVMKLSFAAKISSDRGDTPMP